MKMPNLAIFISMVILYEIDPNNTSAICFELSRLPAIGNVAIVLHSFHSLFFYFKILQAMSVPFDVLFVKFFMLRNNYNAV